MGNQGKRDLDGAGRSLFVCVRDRNGKGASCAGAGAREQLAQMRQMLAAEAIGRDELNVRPCGCLGLCKRGPVMVLAGGPAAQVKQPPKPRKKSARGVYTGVEASELREILREALRPS